MKSKNCDWCGVIIQMPASESRVKEIEYCDKCQALSDAVDEFMEEHRELMDDLTKDD